jgi:hypothetical protein
MIILQDSRDHYRFTDQNAELHKAFQSLTAYCINYKQKF